jgi:hypothetical protein
MIFKSLLSFRSSRANVRESDTDAGIIVVLMMALVFVPIIAAHAAVVWKDQLADIGPQQLATMISAIIPSL